MKAKLVYIPQCLDEALEILEYELTEDNLESFKNLPNTDCLHFGMGMHLRNRWCLWEEGTPLHEWFKSFLLLGHADDMSGVILDSFHRKLNGKPIDLPGQVQRYYKHWLDVGIDPLTLRELACESL